MKLGDTWKVAGEGRRVVGIVENPQSLLDEFALVLPGQVKSPNNVTVLFDAPGWTRARSASSAPPADPSAAAAPM